MAMKAYLKPENAGWQLWQMMASNLTPGNHPYNFTGLCMAMVAQWLLEIKVGTDGRTPEELGRYLLQGWLGQHGYNGLASSQGIYGSHNPLANNHTAMVARHTAGVLTRQNETPVHSHGEHWLEMRSRIYNHANDEIIRLNSRARVYSAHLSLAGAHNRLVSWVAGATWGHAVGLHSNRDQVWFFDPNYGVFIFDQATQGTISLFVKAMWDDYGATSGKIADIV
jgi:hypothetical protein